MRKKWPRSERWTEIEYKGNRDQEKMWKEKWKKKNTDREETEIKHARQRCGKRERLCLRFFFFKDIRHFFPKKGKSCSTADNDI